jgi:guanine deaminase
VINYGAQKNQRIRMEYLKKSNRWNVENLLFGLQITGDERNVEHTFVMGKKIECPS